MNPQKKYFNGFDTLRFAAASLVVFCHIELVRHYRGMYSPVSLGWIYETGKLAVSSFFVLSGFLITWLLLNEKKDGQVNVGYFYLRRGLRIWPLYYLLLIIIFFILPLTGIAYLPEQSEELQAYFGIKLLFFLLLLPQMLYVAFKPVPGSEQFWTIGSEEIFYFIWPWVLKKVKRIDKIAIGVIVVYSIIKSLAWAVSSLPYWENQNINFPYKLYLLLYYNRIDCILLGALAGYFYYKQNTVFIGFVSNKKYLAGAIIGLVVIFSLSSYFGPFDYSIYSFLFCILISALALNKKAHAPVITEFIGKISYGIYLWHFAGIFIAFYLLGLFGTMRLGGMVYTVCLYLTSYGITFALATLSYYLYERWFLSLKNKFKYK